MNRKDRKPFFNLLFTFIVVLFYFLVLNKEIVWGSCAQSISACIGTAGNSCSFTCSNGGTCNGTCQTGSTGPNGVCSSISDCVTPTPVVTPGCGGSAGSCSGACSKTGQSCIPTYFSEGTFFSCECCPGGSSYCPTSTPSPSPTPAPSTPTPTPTPAPTSTPGCEGPIATGMPACFDRPNCPSGTFCAEVGFACACITPTPTPTPDCRGGHTPPSPGICEGLGSNSAGDGHLMPPPCTGNELPVGPCCCPQTTPASPTPASTPTPPPPACPPGSTNVCTPNYGCCSAPNENICKNSTGSNCPTPTPTPTPKPCNSSALPFCSDGNGGCTPPQSCKTWGASCKCQN